MKANIFDITLALTLMAAQHAALAQTNFAITPSLAFQTSFSTKESYQYQVLSSSNLASWAPAAPVQVGTGGVQTLTFSMTGPHAYYRVQENLPNLTNRIVGLTNIYFDDAVYSGQGASMTLSGIRAVSRDYNTNDYLSASFLFDLSRQLFVLTNLQAFTNVGLICGQQYFIKNATNQLLLTNSMGMNTLTPDVTHGLTTTGQVFTVHLNTAQVLSFNVGSPSANVKLLITDPSGKIIQNNILQSGLTWYEGDNGGLIAGTYAFQLIPQGTTSATLTLAFHNSNGKVLTVLTNGQNFSTSLGVYYDDYSKFQVALTSGQTLQLSQPGNGAFFAIYNSLGVKVFDQGDLGTIYFQAPTSDTYYLIYGHVDPGTGHNYSSTATITP